MTEVELELTYLAKKLPPRIASSPWKRIIDVYFPEDDPHPVLRLRQNGKNFQITKKTMANGTDSSHMIEETIPLTGAEFEGLSRGYGKKISKRRYTYDFEGQTAEIDVFEENLAGLVLVDFEFTERDTQQAFLMPDFCLLDVTQEAFISGGKLAGKTYADIAEKLESFNYEPIIFQENYE